MRGEKIEGKERDGELVRGREEVRIELNFCLYQDAKLGYSRSSLTFILPNKSKERFGESERTRRSEQGGRERY